MYYQKWDDFNLHFTFGGVTLTFSNIKVRVKKVHVEEDEYDYNVEWVKLTGVQTDSYDFFYYAGTLFDIYGASVQSGYSSLGTAGYVFKSVVELNEIKKTNINYNFN